MRMMTNVDDVDDSDSDDDDDDDDDNAQLSSWNGATTKSVDFFSWNIFQLSQIF